MKLKIISFLLFLIFIYSCENPTEVKEKRIAGFCLTFDDNYIENWKKIIPILDSNNIKATFFITQIRAISQKEKEIIKLLKSKGNEIAVHGYRHIDANKFLESHTIKEYIEIEIIPSINFLNKLDITPTSFAYPNGFNNDSLDSALLNIFKILRDVTDEQRKPLEKNIEEINEIYVSANNNKITAALGIDKNFKISLEMIEKGFKRASAKNEVIVFYAHNPVKTVTAPYQIKIDYIKKIISLAKKYDLTNHTISELSEL
ncbi:MAG: hypothetical protein CR986_01040 [Ignavibacteriae bacterium]|nr:MAG: hypothetical protein CR986_01040 [Ignavibacteriota bacterium]